MTFSIGRLSARVASKRERILDMKLGGELTDMLGAIVGIGGIKFQKAQARLSLAFSRVEHHDGASQVLELGLNGVDPEVGMEDLDP